jgi:hypothetical protein
MPWLLDSKSRLARAHLTGERPEEKGRERRVQQPGVEARRRAVEALSTIKAGGQQGVRHKRLPQSVAFRPA